jgi:hypothetical protein
MQYIMEPNSWLPLWSFVFVPVPIRMFFQLFAFALAAILANGAAAAAPTVKLDAAIVTGNSVVKIHQFLGILFAQPP